METKRNLTLMQKMTLWFTLIILLPSCVLSVVLYRTMTARAYDLLVEDNYAVLNIARESISRSAASVENMVEMLSLDTDLNKLLSDRRQTQYQRVIKILFDLGELFSQAQLMLSGLDARVSLYFMDARIPETYWSFLRLERLERRENYQRFLSMGKNAGWSGVDWIYPEETDLRPAGNQQMLCYNQKILTGFGECVGVLRCGVSPQKIFSPLQLEGSGDACYVLCGGETIYASDGAKPLPKSYDPAGTKQIIDRQLYLTREVEGMDISLVMRLDYRALHRQALASGMVPFLMALGSGALMLVATCTFLNSIQKRLNQALGFAQRAKEGSMEIAFPDPGADEVGQLIDAVNALLARLQENSRRMIEHERREKYAMRLALQYQMNPHFLFNSLNWIQLSAELGVERDQLSEAVLLLGKLLRSNLKGNAMSTLDEEAQCARDYVRLMNMRKQQLIRLCLELDTLPPEMPVMRFLFQPLCENAIQHGMKQDQPLCIRITGAQQGETACLAVENDGAMIPSDKLALLQDQARDAREGHGIGLANLSARLRLLYGETARITIASEPERTRVEICFPLRQEEPLPLAADDEKE